mmetsp:Transcript_15538/g.28864  ORF Transcript_15538/g.28864 Transcript_15538/m.28864 type:complete len:567 (-) Transcript_15538:7-1707(-)
MRQLHVHRPSCQQRFRHACTRRVLIGTLLALDLSRAGIPPPTENGTEASYDMDPNESMDLNESGNVSLNASNEANDTLDGCLALTPQASPYVNYDAIMQCLQSGSREAVLRDGVFLLHRGLSLPANSRIRGDAAASQRPVLEIAAPTAVTDYVVRTSTNNSVSHLVLDGADKLAAGCCTSVVIVTGNGSRFEDVEAKNVLVGVGVYLMDETSTDNVFHRMHIHNCHYGVIFTRGLKKVHDNVYQDGVLENLACDAVTFAGYGQALGNLVRNNGFGCQNGANLPGSGFRCHGNIAGGVIVGNTIEDNCGMSLDVDSCANFNVSYNKLQNPGNTFDGAHLFCAGAATFTLLDSQNFLIQGNQILNSRVSNMLKNALGQDPNNIFRDTDTAALADLPAGENTVLNFVIARRPFKDSMLSIGHQVVDNQFQCTCSRQEPACVGLGYFVGRGTGHVDNAALFQASMWPTRQDQKPSIFQGNDPLDSDLGSKRCGSNWYAHNSPDCLQDAIPPCNRDDHLHGRKPFRNDDCSAFASQLSSPSKREVGQLRVPLPLEPNRCLLVGPGGPHAVC